MKGRDSFLHQQKFALPWHKCKLSKETSPRVAVIILHYGDPELTRRCLDIAQTVTRLDANWIVIDNHSPTPLKGLSPDTILIRTERNLGFTGGVNLGLSLAMKTEAEFFWLLNNDAEPTQGALEALVAAMDRDPAAGLASSVIVNSDSSDEIVFHGGYWDGASWTVTRDGLEYGRWAQDAPERIWLAGTALLIRRSVVLKIGYLDDRFFMYYEDNDYSSRSAMAGFNNIIVAESIVRHPNGPEIGDFTRRPHFYYFMVRNIILLHYKMKSPPKVMYWTLRRIVRWYFRPGLSRQSRRAIRIGLTHALMQRYGPLTVKL